VISQNMTVETRIDTDAAMTAEQIARVAKAMAHPERVRILQRFLWRRPHLAREISERSSLAQSTVSEHLRILREAGLLATKREGARTWYSLDPAALDSFSLAVSELVPRLASPGRT
jgi:DNA-binding transcriptional ArsR family regulator